MAFVIKAAVRDSQAKTFAFGAQIASAEGGPLDIDQAGERSPIFNDAVDDQAIT
jgi:hypothetical protein